MANPLPRIIISRGALPLIVLVTILILLYVLFGGEVHLDLQNSDGSGADLDLVKRAEPATSPTKEE